MRSADDLLHVTWRAIACDDANYIRQELELSSTGDQCVVQEIKWLDESIPAARTMGQVDGSPIVADSFFLGCEDPHALNLVDTTNSGSGTRVSCRSAHNALLVRGEKLTRSFVCGVAPESQMRRAFLYYLEKERAHPYRPFLHYNSWYDIAWEPFALNETNCLEAIRLFGERFVKPYGAVMDAVVFDDGWDNPQTLWQFHGGFPNGFTPLARLCRRYGTHLGVWLSPFGGYGESRNQRLKFGAAQGYETNATGFSLAGPKYYTAFKQACAGMIHNYGVNHFKFDGIATGMYAKGGAGYYRDTEAMRRLMLELRQEEPSVYINLTTGSWPSPFWLRYADSVWRQGGDMGLAGKGPRQQQWLTYRDQEVYRNIVQKGPLFPLNSLMTQGVAYSRKGSAGDPTFDSAGFKDDVRAFFASGTSLQELYIQPGKLTAQDWNILAEAARWSRANSDVLVDTHWIGGDPSRGEVYGYASWNPRKGIVMLRNPDEREHTFSLSLAQAFELPPGAADDHALYVLKSPWFGNGSVPTIAAPPKTVVPITLPPFAVLVYEATQATH
ncbi:MAG TPA: enterotoxin [Verrucomicrobiae bacterium]